MVKKLGLTSLIFTSRSNKKQVDSAAASTTAAPSSMASSSSSMSASSWQWPSCKQPRTLSFRQQQVTAYKTMNSAYLPDSVADSCFSNSFASVDGSLSTASEAASGLVEANEREAVIRALRSDRLFFEPHTSLATSSIVLKKAKLKVKDDKGTTCCGASGTDKQMTAFDGATAMTMDSSNPYSDFRASMEEMVMSHGAKDWRWLEEMLRWYLRANGKSTHFLIVGAFVDLLVTLSDTASPSSPTTASTNGSSFTGNDEIKEEGCTERAVNGYARTTKIDVK